MKSSEFGLGITEHFAFSYFSALTF